VVRVREGEADLLYERKKRLQDEGVGHRTWGKLRVKFVGLREGIRIAKRGRGGGGECQRHPLRELLAPQPGQPQENLNKVQRENYKELPNDCSWGKRVKG